METIRFFSAVGRDFVEPKVAACQGRDSVEPCLHFHAWWYRDNDRSVHIRRCSECRTDLVTLSDRAAIAEVAL